MPPQDINKINAQIEDMKRRLSILEKAPPIDRHLDNVSKDIITQIISDNILDMVWNEYFYWNTFFEALDGWTPQGGGTASAEASGVTLTTSNTNNSYIAIEKAPNETTLLSFDQPSRFRTSFICDHGSTTFGIGIGDCETFSIAVTPHYGFRAENGIVYAVTGDGVSETKLSTGVSFTDDGSLILCEARLYPGFKVVFFVSAPNGNYVQERCTITTTLPQGLMRPLVGSLVPFMTAILRATTNAFSHADISNVEYIQQRDPQSSS